MHPDNRTSQLRHHRRASVFWQPWIRRVLRRIDRSSEGEVSSSGPAAASLTYVPRTTYMLKLPQGRPGLTIRACRPSG